MTGTHWLEESGFLDGPVLITNTHSVGVVRDAYLGWLVKNNRKPGTNVFDGGFYTYPIVAETYDGFLNDINGFHVKPGDVHAALDGAAAGRVAEGNVGGGTGMVCYGFKGGIGTSSRKTGKAYTVGVLVQCNCGSRRQLRIGGVPVGQEIPDNPPAGQRRSTPTATIPARSSSWSRPMRRCCRIRPSASPAAPPWGWRVPVPLGQRLGRHLHRILHREPQRRGRRRRRSMSPCCRTMRSTPSSKPQCRPPKRPSSTPWSAPKP